MHWWLTEQWETERMTMSLQVFVEAAQGGKTGIENRLYRYHSRVSSRKKCLGGK